MAFSGLDLVGQGWDATGWDFIPLAFFLFLFSFNPKETFD
jgi:hypothetical protein